MAAALEAERQAEEDEPSEDDTADAEEARTPTTARTARATTSQAASPRPPRRRGGRGGARRKPKALEGTFDHGEEGFGLWLDPAVQDDPIYAEHWAGHRPVTVTIEPDRIVISRAGRRRPATRDDADGYSTPDAVRASRTPSTSGAKASAGSPTRPGPPRSTSTTAADVRRGGSCGAGSARASWWTSSPSSTAPTPTGRLELARRKPPARTPRASWTPRSRATPREAKDFAGGRPREKHQKPE